MLTPNMNITEMDEIIGDIKEKIESLKKLSQDIPCVHCNCERLMASVKMLELNISDAREYYK